MQAPVLHTIQQQHFWLSASRTVFWEEKQTLILSDMHLGKSGHFRKAGIPIPQKIYLEDLQRLTAIIQFHKAKRLLVVGDMFHSHHNKELDWFLKWRKDFEHLNIQLIKGNHDILDAGWYTHASIRLYKDIYIEDGFAFTHDAPLQQSNAAYTFTGHIHPGIKIPGLAKQQLNFPCFYFTSTMCVLPAYSHFTGYINMPKATGSTCYAIINQTLVKV